MLQPDGTWLEVPEMAVLRELAGTVLMIVLVISVVALAANAVAWGLHRAGLRRLGEAALGRMGQAVGAAVVLGALSGLVGWSSGLI